MKKFMTALLALAITAAAPFLVFAGWQQEGSGYVYYEADGSKATNIFRKRGMDWYYLDENGNVVKNCEREINGKVYSFDANGV